MQIKIVDCSREIYWYSKRIGEVFDVVDEDATDYYIEQGEYSISCMVSKEDAEIVNENNDRCYEDACMSNNVTLQPGDYVCTKGMTEEQYYAVVEKFMAAGVDKDSSDYSYEKYAADEVESYLGWDSRDNELWDCRHVASGFDGRELTVEQVLGSECVTKDVTPNYYAKWYKGVKLDPYRIAQLYEIGGGPQEQVLKKALRGCHKGHEELQVIKEIRQALDRWEEMLEEDSLTTSQRDTEEK